MQIIYIKFIGDSGLLALTPSGNLFRLKEPKSRLRRLSMVQKILCNPELQQN